MLIPYYIKSACYIPCRWNSVCGIICAIFIKDLTQLHALRVEKRVKYSRKDKTFVITETSNNLSSIGAKHIHTSLIVSLLTELNKITQLYRYKDFTDKELTVLIPLNPQ